MTTLDVYARFLTARWDEAEDAAKRAAFGWGAEWRSETDDIEEWSVVHADGKRDMVGCEDGDVTRHIALLDPAAVLADLATKRAIAFRAKVWAEQHGHTTPDGNGYGETSTAVAVLAMCLEDLASPFRDHPDHPANQETKR